VAYGSDGALARRGEELRWLVPGAAPVSLTLPGLVALVPGPWLGFSGGRLAPAAPYFDSAIELDDVFTIADEGPLPGVLGPRSLSARDVGGTIVAVSDDGLAWAIARADGDTELLHGVPTGYCE
jgi:hypothetical protein